MGRGNDRGVKLYGRRPERQWRSGERERESGLIADGHATAAAFKAPTLAGGADLRRPFEARYVRL